MAGALGAFQGQWGTDIPLLCAGSLLILAPTLTSSSSSSAGSSPRCSRARSRDEAMSTTPFYGGVGSFGP